MTAIKRFPRNVHGRDFIVGDIHGAYDYLEEALTRIAFDPARDRLFSVGDLTDRGKRSPDCLHYLRQHWFHAVRGNHEEKFLDLFDATGAFNAAALDKDHVPYRAWVRQTDIETLRAIRDAMASLPIAIEIETRGGLVGIIHAEVPAGMNWRTFTNALTADDADTRHTAQWSRKRYNANDNEKVSGIARIFSGHTPSHNGIRRMGNRYYIDTGAPYRERGSHLNAGLSLVEINAPSHALAGPHDTSQAVRIYPARRPHPA